MENKAKEHGGSSLSVVPNSGAPHPRVGINSVMIKEISNGPIFAKEIELIELNVENPEVLDSGVINYAFLDKVKSLGNKFSIHGPYADYGGVDRNLAVMKNVLLIADYLDVKSIVMHSNAVTNDYRDAMLKVIAALKQYCRVAAQYSVTLLIENMVRERKNDRVGVLPTEVLQVIEAVNEENLKFCFDIGHGNLAANQYKFDILDFVTALSPYLYQVHVHDNLGIPAVVDEKFGDQHLALGKGKIDYTRIFRAIDKSTLKNIVLELYPPTTRTNVLRSISILRAFQNGVI